jgi:hypothetical protein
MRIHGRIKAARHAESGMNLVEMLIGIAIFSFGILQVLSMFPAGVYCGAEVMRSVHATILGRSAMAELEYQARVPLYSGTLSTISGSTLTVSGTPNWGQDQWVNSYISLSGRPDDYAYPAGTPAPRLQSSRITANTIDTVTCDQPPFVVAPQPGDSIRIAACGLPRTAQTQPSRECKVETISAKRISSQPANWDPALVGTTPASKYFIIMTTGRASGKVYVVTDFPTGATDPPRAILCDAANFLSDGVVLGDYFFIAGCPSTAGIIQPTPNFGVPKLSSGDPLQTVLSHHFRAMTPPVPESAYSFATIISNVRNPGIETVDAARVDVIVFFRYDQAQPPDKNRAAIGHCVRYLGRR